MTRVKIASVAVVVGALKLNEVCHEKMALGYNNVNRNAQINLHSVIRTVSVHIQKTADQTSR